MEQGAITGGIAYRRKRGVMATPEIEFERYVDRQLLEAAEERANVLSDACLKILAASVMIWQLYYDAKDKAAELERQIDKLANFIIEDVDGEPSQNEGAIDCAIRIITAYQSRPERRLPMNCEAEVERLTAICQESLNWFEIASNTPLAEAIATSMVRRLRAAIER